MQSVFYLDPVVNLYHKKQSGLDYSLPAKMVGSTLANEDIAIIYPGPFAKVLLTTDLKQKKQQFISKAISVYPRDTLHWFLDSKSIGMTSTNHAIQLYAGPGVHNLTIVSVGGGRQSHRFTVLEE